MQGYSALETYVLTYRKEDDPMLYFEKRGCPLEPAPDDPLTHSTRVVTGDEEAYFSFTQVPQSDLPDQQLLPGDFNIGLHAVYYLFIFGTSASYVESIRKAAVNTTGPLSCRNDPDMKLGIIGTLRLN